MRLTITVTTSNNLKQVTLNYKDKPRYTEKKKKN